MQANSITMQQVAKRAGVSLSTVSRVCNRFPSIHQDTRETVLRAMQELGYKLDLLETIKDEQETVISVWLCPLQEQQDLMSLDFFTTLISGVRDELGEQSGKIEQEIHSVYMPNLPQVNTQGVILVGVPSEELRAVLRQKNIPYIIASCDMHYCPDENLVSANNYQAGVLGCKRLLARGAKRIGFLINPNLLPRFAGFAAEMLNQGMIFQQSDLRFLANTEYDTAIDYIQQWIAQGDLPDALVVDSYPVAKFFRPILQFNHIRVPEDIRLLGFHHFISNKPVIPYEGIDVLYIDPYKLGRLAAQRIMTIVRSVANTTEEKSRNPDFLPQHKLLPMVFGSD